MHYQCPLCGTHLVLSADEIWYYCCECGFNEHDMAIEEELQVP